MKTFNYSKQVTSFMESQGKTNSNRLRNAIIGLPTGDVKKLNINREPPLFRLRVGNYRIIFTVNGDIYNILFAGNRGEVYRYISKL
ncbi:MAG: type II toxin-antitoxin system RelE/ParE family toxin [Firmicutes bacterium]|nr:type II toxin-antitoxin system RelE/ParE family toxin [Bacillota bacterium]